MQQEYELIEHSILKNVKVFLVNLDYRTPHIHGDMEMCLILNGGVTLFSRSRQLHFDKDDFFLLSPCTPHELRADKHALILSIQIKKSLCMDYYPQINGMEFLLVSGRSAFPAEKANLLRDTAISLAYAYFSMEKGFEFKCMSLVNELLYLFVCHLPTVCLSEDGQKKQWIHYERIQEITEYIDAHYTEKLLLTEIAEMQHLSLHYLSHLFKDYFQMSFQQYLPALRCEKARQLLLLTNLNLLDISLESGFSDIKYLNKAFARQYGYSPRAYRVQFDLEELPSKQRSILSTQEFLSPKASLVSLNRLGEMGFG